MRGQGMSAKTSSLVFHLKLHKVDVDVLQIKRETDSPGQYSNIHSSPLIPFKLLVCLSRLQTTTSMSQKCILWKEKVEIGECVSGGPL